MINYKVIANSGGAPFSFYELWGDCIIPSLMFFELGLTITSNRHARRALFSELDPQNLKTILKTFVALRETCHYIQETIDHFLSTHLNADLQHIPRLYRDPFTIHNPTYFLYLNALVFNLNQNGLVKVYDNSRSTEDRYFILMTFGNLQVLLAIDKTHGGRPRSPLSGKESRVSIYDFGRPNSKHYKSVTSQLCHKIAKTDLAKEATQLQHLFSSPVNYDRLCQDLIRKMTQKNYPSSSIRQIISSIKLPQHRFDAFSTLYFSRMDPEDFDAACHVLPLIDTLHNLRKPLKLMVTIAPLTRPHVETLNTAIIQVLERQKHRHTRPEDFIIGLNRLCMTYLALLKPTPTPDDVQAYLAQAQSHRDLTHSKALARLTHQITLILKIHPRIHRA